MITAKDVEDLAPGDVVEVVEDEYPDTITRGALHFDKFGNLTLGRAFIVRTRGGGVWRAERSVTVISRAPKLFYVNHSRTLPTPGDVAAAVDGPTVNEWRPTWTWSIRGEWVSTHTGWATVLPPGPLKLLVDGNTGQVVVP